MYRTDFWTLWEKARVGWSERTALKHIYYQVWNTSPVQVGCMRQVLGAGALGWPRRMGWGGRCEGGSRWGTHVNPWLTHVNVWQKPLQYCKVISLQLINGKKKRIGNLHRYHSIVSWRLVKQLGNWRISVGRCSPGKTSSVVKVSLIQGSLIISLFCSKIGSLSKDFW